MRQEQTINIDMGGEKGGSKRGLTFWRPNTHPIFYPSVCRVCVAVWKHSSLGCFGLMCVCWWKNAAKREKDGSEKPPELGFSLVFGASDVHIAVYLAALCARPFCSRKTSLPRQWCRGHRLFPPAWTRQGRVAS